MQKSTALASVLERLRREARARGLTDSAWARRAGLSKETLSRLGGRDTCDFRTLVALAGAVDAGLAVVPGTAAATSSDGHMPAKLTRDYEERLAALCTSRDREARSWRRFGPAFFMSGLAVLAASAPYLDRRELLGLAEELHPGMSDPAVFARWLERSPARPARFFPILDEHAHRRG